MFDPLENLGSLLLSVEKPARYIGGEYGILARKGAVLKTLIAFPDLYEIGMSNQALKILYNRLNRIEGVSCDRAFAPAPDFENLLRDRALPLYGLDTGISLGDTDILMFTLGYELGITNVFSMLDLSGIPLHADKRKDDDPIVIMGGPCVSNPLPYAAYVDAFWIGEAEAGFFDLVAELKEIKTNGGKRDALLGRLLGHPSVWSKGKGSAVRAVDLDFPGGQNGPSVFPVPNMKVVHHHGSVEIMRGCPNGCRFCHAGYWYRPMRQKNAAVVEAETTAFVREGGFREISLLSLSSGDYRHLEELVDSLNAKFGGEKVSFQLPSLRVSSFSLNLLDKVSEVRKSGLTFAVETPVDFWQMAINKRVSRDDVISILREAKRHGWRGAKFYFMLGLPLEGRPAETETSLKSEEEEILEFIEYVAKQTGMHFNINVGTFVPKPHTPFQWAGQMSREKAEQKFSFLRSKLKPRGHKLGVQDPLISVLEGIASRGDERAGLIFEEAYRLGCRLDSWNEYLRREIWEGILGRYADLAREFLDKKNPGVELPWACIKSGISDTYFSKEFSRSRTGELTSGCTEKCNNPCGICGNSRKLVQNIIQGDVTPWQKTQPGVEKTAGEKLPEKKTDPDTHRILFSFSKTGKAVFQPHLNVVEMFTMAFTRAEIPVLHSRGFNPLPRLEIASPISLGIRALAEIAAIDTEFPFDADAFVSAINSFLPPGIKVLEALNICIPSSRKKFSLSARLWGYVYAGREEGARDLVKAENEKTYRQSRLGPDGSVYDLERISVLAKTGDPALPDGASHEGASYFEVFRALYPSP